MKVTFAGFECDVVFEKYAANGQHAILLRESGTGMPVCTATVCIPDWEPFRKPNWVAIKDYSENEGIFDALYDAGIVKGCDFNPEDGTDDREHIYLWPVGHTAATLCILSPVAVVAAS